MNCYTNINGTAKGAQILCTCFRKSLNMKELSSPQNRLGFQNTVFIYFNFLPHLVITPFCMKIASTDYYTV